MNRIEFGQLVAALRKEHIDESGKFWTQEKLGEKTGLGTLIIGNIERGQKTGLNESILLRLANALQLTTGERREFFLAAVGIENEKMVRDYYDPSTVLDESVAIMQKVQSPAFIMDSYYDILAVNPATLRLYDISSAELSDFARRTTSFNTLRFFFGPEFEKQREMMGERWEELARQNIRDFRTYSLQYRTTPYFIELLSELRTYPLFHRYWLDIYWEERDHICHDGYFHLRSPWGALEYVATSYRSLTRYGYLILCIYVPVTPETSSVFANIAREVGQGCYRLGPWPKEQWARPPIIL